MAEIPDIEEPEAPDWIKSYRFIWHHIKREGSVVRGAPGAIILAVVIVGAIEYWFLGDRYEDRYSGQISGLQATIQDQQAMIQYQDARLGMIAGKETSTATVGEARFRLVGLPRHDMDGHYGVNAYFQNIGSVAAIGDVHTLKSEIVDKTLSDDEVDKRFASFEKGEKVMEKLDVTSQTQPNDIEWWTQVSNTIRSNDVDDQINHGKKLLYTFVRIKYRDDGLPKGKWRVTEVCVFTFGMSADHRCAQHNFIGLSN